MQIEILAEGSDEVRQYLAEGEQHMSLIGFGSRRPRRASHSQQMGRGPEAYAKPCLPQASAQVSRLRQGCFA